MKIKEVIEKIEKAYPLSTQLSWDNSGLQVGDFEREVSGIYICLDCEIENLKEAISKGSNLIITHHPLFFGGIRSLKRGSFHYDIVSLAIKNDLSIYSSHTPFDASPLGMKKTPLLKFAKKIDHDFAREGEISFGTVVDIDACSFELFIMNILEDLRKYGLTENTRIYKANDRPIKRVAIMGGSGADYIGLASDLGADVYITGDIKYHDAQRAYRLGLNLIDLGHDQSEMHFVDLMKEYLSDTGLEIFTSYKTFR